MKMYNAPPVTKILLLSVMNIDKKPFVLKKNNLCFQWTKNKTHHTNNTQMAKWQTHKGHTDGKMADTNDTQMTKWQTQTTHTFTNDKHIHK